MSDKRITVWVQRFKDRSTLVLQWIDPATGRRKSRSAETSDSKEADDKRTDLESDLNNDRYQEAARMSWERFRELFEAEYVAGLRENTQRNYRNTLDLFEHLCNTTRLSAVTERTISGLVAAMRKQPTRGRVGMLASTISVRLQFLHTVLQWAVDQKFLARVPKFPRVTVLSKDPQPVPTETFERLFEKADDDPVMRVYLLTGWLAGLRLQEASLLEWEETREAPYVDFARDRIVLPAELVKGKRDQWLPLDPKLRKALEGLPRHGRKVFRFVSRKIGAPLTRSGLSDRVADLAKKAGVRMTMKTLRRGFGSRYAGRVPAQVLQKLMRHANIRTTMTFYANIDDAVMEAVMGPKRNGLCNTQADTQGKAKTDTGVTPCQGDTSAF